MSNISMSNILIKKIFNIFFLFILSFSHPSITNAYFDTHSLDLESSSSQYLSIADNAQSGLDLTGDFTYEAWIKIEALPSVAGANMNLITKWDSLTENRAYIAMLGWTDDKLQVQYSQDGTEYNRTIVTSSSAFVTATDVGKWVHVAIAVDTDTRTVNLYKNAVLVSTTTLMSNATSIKNSDAPLNIGTYNDSGNALDGQIDDVRIWNVARTNQEVSDNYQKELQGDEGNLVAYWKLNNSFSDSTTHGNILTAYNNPLFTIDTQF